MRESTTTDTAITHCTLLQFDGRLPYDLPHQPNQWSDSDAVQLDRPGPGAVAGADGVQDDRRCDGEFPARSWDF